MISVLLNPADMSSAIASSIRRYSTADVRTVVRSNRTL